MFDLILPLVALLPVTVTLVVVARGLLTARRELRALYTIEKAPLRTALPVVIPARNEGARIGPTLEALLRDPSDKLAVIVYDDHSTDDTAQVVAGIAARDPRVTLVPGVVDDTPGFGKPKALHHALAHVDKDAFRVLFLDADVHVEPGTLGGMVRILESTRAGALSGSPALVTGSVVEELLVPAVVALVGARFRPSRVNDPGYPDAFLNGQLILVDKRALDETGGFLAVKDTVLEDVALALRLKRQGFPLRLADLRPHASTRMYVSWGEIRRGFGKNMVPLLGGPGPALAYAAAGVALGLAPLASVVTGALLSPWIAAAAAALAVVVMLGQARLRTSLGTRGWPALVVPVTQLLVAFILVEAAVKAWTRGAVEWRGRAYPASAALPASVLVPGPGAADLDALNASLLPHRADE